MKSLFTLALCLVFIETSLAQESYPELMVAPKASERLKREASEETKGTFMTHLPLQISGLTTLLAGITSNADLNKGKDSEGIGPKLAMAVGGGWVVASILFQSAYRPYVNGHLEVKKMAYQSTRDQLAAERMAEEHIDQTARLARKIKWLSFGTNALASAFAMSSAEKDSFGKAVSIAGIAASFIPLLFPNKAEQVSEDQRSYKKKVFGPMSLGTGLLNEPGRGNLVPGLSFVTVF
jgi:hypothetical protein